MQHIILPVGVQYAVLQRRHLLSWAEELLRPPNQPTVNHDGASSICTECRLPSRGTARAAIQDRRTSCLRRRTAYSWLGDGTPASAARRAGRGLRSASRVAAWPGPPPDGIAPSDRFLSRFDPCGASGQQNGRHVGAARTEVTDHKRAVTVPRRPDVNRLSDDELELIEFGRVDLAHADPLANVHESL